MFRGDVAGLHRSSHAEVDECAMPPPIASPSPSRSAGQRIHVVITVNGLPMGSAGRAEGPGNLGARGRHRAIERVDIFPGLDLISAL
jgi:hypothetical protein